MNLPKNLESLGLSRNESIVYLSCLQLGRDTVLNIAKHADLKRPTVYLILENLEKRSLITKTKKAHKTLYKAESPKQLLMGIQMQHDLAAEILPSLQAIYNIDPEKPNIKIAEGIQSVRGVYNSVFTFLANHPEDELLIFGSLKKAAEKFEHEVLDYFSKSMAKSHNHIREIGNDDSETRKYFRTVKRLNPNHEIRLIRSGGGLFEADNLLYGNTLVILSVDEQIFATSIESSAIANTYKTLFNMAWRSGRKYVV